MMDLLCSRQQDGQNTIATNPSVKLHRTWFWQLLTLDGCNGPAEGPLSSLTRSFPFDPPGELFGEGRSYGAGPGSVEFEVSGPVDEFVDPGVDVVHRG